MKEFLKVMGLAGILVLVLAVRALAAPAAPSQTFQAGMYTPQVITVTPQAQSTPVIPTPDGQGTTFWGNMMGGGHMGRMGRSMMGSGQMGRGMMGRSSETNETMMTEVTPMHDDVAMQFGMSTQDLYNHMASGKSLVEIAAEKGITEQALIDGIMASRRAMYDQAVMGGYMTQAQADIMLQEMNNNLQMMVNGQGVQSNGWGMMWGTPTP